MKGEAAVGRTEIKLEFLGTSGINSFIANVSTPRAVMDFSHMSSRPSLLHPDEPIIKTGIEYELGKYINDVRAEHDCVVKGFVPKFANSCGTPSELMALVEYEYKDRLYLDMIEIPTCRATHGTFGYSLTPTEAVMDMGYNSVIPKDTILATTQSYGKEGCYNYGLNANVVFMSHPAVAEDGIVISESFAKRLSFSVVLKRVINITKDMIPLNLYGDENFYKFIPDIGERVRKDGLLCAVRERNDWFSIVDMNTESLMELDSTFDISTYAIRDAVVQDINVIRGNYNKPELPADMTRQLDHYADLQIQYYRSIVKIYEKAVEERKRYGLNIKTSPRLTRLITDCLLKIQAAETNKVKLCHRKLNIDQYRVEVTLMGQMVPTLGFKLTDINGGKGVVCAVLPDEDMPIDAWGVRADVITDSNSTISRMNPGRSYQHYLGAAARDNRKRLLAKYGDHPLTHSDITEIIDYLRGFYALINSESVAFIDSLTEEERYHHVREVLKHQLSIYYPPDNERNIVDIIDEMEKTIYKPNLSRLWYRDGLGRVVETLEEIRIGRMTILLLEKIATDYSSVSSAKVNSFSFPIKGGASDKYKYPHSVTPTTTLGETETRIIASLAPPVMIAELMDLASNPISHKLLVKGILESKMAFDKAFDIDRKVITYGNTKSLMLLRHIMTGAGFDFEYVPEDTDLDWIG